MKVMVIVKATPSSEAGEMPSEQLLSDMTSYNEELVRAGIMLDGQGLQPSSKGVRIRFSGSERTVTDGPFTETNELVAGYWIWKVQSMEEAVAWARRCPNPMPESSELEIRPIYDLEDFGDLATPEIYDREFRILIGDIDGQLLAPPRFETRGPRTFAGISRPYTPETQPKIPEQWTDFCEVIDKIPQRIGEETFGLCSDFRPPCNFNYMCGVEVQPGTAVSGDLQTLDVPAQQYAVFAHRAHFSELPKSFEAIMSKWLPQSKFTEGDGPSFERYTSEFNPELGKGGIEIWLPVKQ